MALESDLAEMQDALRQQRTGRKVLTGRRSATVAAAVSYTAATAGYVADGTAGPAVTVRVGPSGRLGVTVSARLAITSGTTPRLAMGYSVTGPWLDEAMTTAPTGVTPGVVLGASDARALSVAGVAEVSASRASDATGLVPGWYRVAALYSLTGSGTLAAAASLRELIAAPV